MFLKDRNWPTAAALSVLGSLFSVLCSLFSVLCLPSSGAGRQLSVNLSSVFWPQSSGPGRSTTLAEVYFSEFSFQRLHLARKCPKEPVINLSISTTSPSIRVQT